MFTFTFIEFFQANMIYKHHLCLLWIVNEIYPKNGLCSDQTKKKKMAVDPPMSLVRQVYEDIFEKMAEI